MEPPQTPPQPQVQQAAPRVPWNTDAIRAPSATQMAEVLESVLSDIEQDEDIAECFIPEGIDGQTFLDIIVDGAEVILGVLADCSRPKRTFTNLKKELRRKYPNL